MGYLLGVVILILGVLASIALHEVGHMVPAKLFGVRVSQYMVGFGRTLWSRTKGETEYGFKAIPLGGYVRMVGMFPPGRAPMHTPTDSDDVVVNEGAKPRRGRARAGRIAEIIDDTRAISVSEILPGEEHRAFYNLSAPKKLVVMLGGPVMNLLIAVLLTGIVMVGFGMPVASTTVESVVPCLPTTTAPTQCAPGAPQSPASAAGLLAGDTIVSFGGREVETWADLTAAIKTVGAQATEAVVVRGSERLTLDVDPAEVTRAVVDADGKAVQGTDGVDQTTTSVYIGIAPATVQERASLTEVPGVVWNQVTATAGIVVTLPVHVWNVAKALVTGSERDGASVISVVGVGQVAGQIGAADGAQITAGDRIAGWLSLLAALNVALFAFNLIPLLPLDGGHVVGALYEGARRQIARARGLARPGPADTARMMPLAYGVFVALIGISVVLVIADLVRPVTLG